jgi:hypothetical protein
LLDDTDPAGSEGHESPIVTEGRDANPCCLGRIENGFSLLDLDLYPVDREFDLICHTYNQ